MGSCVLWGLKNQRNIYTSTRSVVVGQVQIGVVINSVRLLKSKMVNGDTKWTGRSAS